MSTDHADYKSLFDYKLLYFELIMQVAKKFPGETRHETALRYIVECQIPNNQTKNSVEDTG